ncbi:MAG: restriction endonuclease subunit S [Prevotellaceae bacterium]|jgi:type I restriction enzyme S subunit|nr:restriction endonuclease subunit S [Prevotellaceae bacterium]
MAIKKGYKQTDVGIIPEEWEVKNLKEILASYQLGGNYSNSDELSEFPLIKMGNINRGYIDLSKIQYIKHNVCPNDKDLLYDGDVLFNTRNTLELVGKVAIWRNELPIAYFNSNLMRFKFNEKYISSTFFINLILNTKQSLQQLKGIAIGTTSVAAIYTRDLLYIQIPIPTLAEQTAIATALSDMDALITALDKKIAKKKLIKQGVMQQLLIPKKNWKIRKIKEICHMLKGNGLSKSQLNSFGKYKCLLYGELFTTYNEIIHDIRSQTDSEEGVYSQQSDILFPGSTTTIGIDLAKSSTILIDNVKLGGDIIVLRKKDYEYNSVYVTYFLNTLKRLEIAQNTKGITIHHLHGKDLIDIEIHFPSLEEQTAIAQILSDMDNEIAALEAKRDKYKQVKSGMMQELLTGKIRLVNENAVSTLKQEAKTIQVDFRQSKKPAHNDQINEAVVVSFLVNKFGTVQYPLSRFRYTKYAYLLHRQHEHEATGYNKHAAGPYKPENRYKGAEGIAIKNKYISKVKNPKSDKDAFVANENIGKALNYFNDWYGTDIQQWIEQFRYYKNDYLEVLATVDESIVDLTRMNKPIGVKDIKEYITSIPQWKDKLDKPYFTDFNIQKAINESCKLFGDN